MGLGIVAFIKSLTPWSVFLIGVILAFRAMSGRTEWTLMFLIALIPLRNVVEKLQSLPAGKDFIDILIIVLLIGWAIRAFSNGEKLFAPSVINVIAIIFIIYTFISLLQGSAYLGYFSSFQISDPRVQSWKNLCLQPILFFMTFNTIKDKKWVWRTIFVMCVTILFMDSYLVRQITWYTSLVSREKIRGTFVFLGPNEVAAFYNQYTVLLMGLYFFMKKNRFKKFLLALIVINIFCILFLFSRAAYAALAVGMFFLFAMKKKAFLIPLILAAVFWQIVLPPKVIERIEMTTNEYGELDASSATRLVVWERSLELFQENPVTGVGYGVFQYLGFELGDTHNIYLKILAEQGVIGLFIFLLLLFCFFTQGLRLYAKGDDPLVKGLGLGFAISIIVLLVNNMFGDRWTYMEISAYLWVFAGLVARLNITSIDTSLGKLNLKQKSKTKRMNGKFVS